DEVPDRLGSVIGEQPDLDVALSRPQRRVQLLGHVSLFSSCHGSLGVTGCSTRDGFPSPATGPAHGARARGVTRRGRGRPRAGTDLPTDRMRRSVTSTCEPGPGRRREPPSTPVTARQGAKKALHPVRATGAARGARVLTALRRVIVNIP